VITIACMLAGATWALFLRWLISRDKTGVTTRRLAYAHVTALVALSVYLMAANQ
jgi:hypothetical protein